MRPESYLSMGHATSGTHLSASISHFSTGFIGTLGTIATTMGFGAHEK